MLTIESPYLLTYIVAPRPAGPPPRDGLQRALLSLHAHGLAVAQLFGSGCDDLLAVREAGEDLLLVAARLSQTDRAPLHPSLAVDEYRRGAAFLHQSRTRDEHPSCRGRRAPLLTEERDLDAHVGKDARIQAIEGRPHLHRRLLPVRRRDHGAHLGRDL